MIADPIVQPKVEWHDIYMPKISVVIAGLHYPMTMLRYFWEAFLRRDDVDLFVVGPFFGNWIPWMGGMYLPQKYVLTPDFPLPPEAATHHVHPQMIVDKLPKNIDLFIQIDAGWHFSARPPGEVVAHIQTDPHVLKSTYQLPKSYSDVNFCMQTPYIEASEIYLPYAYDPTVHYPMDLVKEWDVCCIGLQYEKRTSVMKGLNKIGISTNYETGKIFDEYRIAYNKSRIAFSWSSLQDLPARVWEGMAMGLPVVTNYVPDLNNFFTEGVHYLGFNDVDGAIGNVKWLLDNLDKAKKIADNGYEVMMRGKHSWDDRVDFILEKCGYGQ